MLNYGKRLTAAAGVLVTAGAVAIGGLTAASASPAARYAAQPAARTAHATARAATSGTAGARSIGVSKRCDRRERAFAAVNTLCGDVVSSLISRTRMRLARGSLT